MGMKTFTRLFGRLVVSTCAIAMAMSLPAAAQEQDSGKDKPVVEDLSRPVSPLDQVRWARAIIDNYPSQALVQRMEGVVGVRLTINTSGRVENCRVVRSSGHGVLDVAACQGLVAHATFNPAHNLAGAPVEASWSTDIIYSIN